MVLEPRRSFTFGKCMRRGWISLVVGVSVWVIGLPLSILLGAITAEGIGGDMDEFSGAVAMFLCYLQFAVIGAAFVVPGLIAIHRG